MSDEYTALPARIHLQIREGAPNPLAEFELRARSSTPETDGTITHDVASIDIIEGLAIALRQQIHKYRAAGTASIEGYLVELRDWIFKEDAK